MTTLTWAKNLVVEKDPDSKKLYAVDFTTWLAGETMASLVVLEAAGVTAVVKSGSTTATGASITVEGGTPGLPAYFTLRITTTNRIEDFTVRLSITNH